MGHTGMGQARRRPGRTRRATLRSSVLVDLVRAGLQRRQPSGDRDRVPDSVPVGRPARSAPGAAITSARPPNAAAAGRRPSLAKVTRSPANPRRPTSPARLSRKPVITSSMINRAPMPFALVAQHRVEPGQRRHYSMLAATASVITHAISSPYCRNAARTAASSVVGQHDRLGRRRAGDAGVSAARASRRPTPLRKQRIDVAVVAAAKLDHLGPAVKPRASRTAEHRGLGAAADRRTCSTGATGTRSPPRAASPGRVAVRGAVVDSVLESPIDHVRVAEWPRIIGPPEQTRSTKAGASRPRGRARRAHHDRGLPRPPGRPDRGVTHRA